MLNKLSTLADWFDNKIAAISLKAESLFKKKYDYKYEDMTKDELEEIGRLYGIELDKRYKKETLIKKLKELDK